MAEPTTEPTPYVHRYSRNAAAIYAESLSQIEDGVCAAWQNVLLNPADRGAVATYEQRREQLRTVEADRDRVLAPPAAPPAEAVP